MGASVELASSKGIRVLPLEDFVLGPGRTALARGEVLAAVRAPSCGHWKLSHYEKVGRREAQAISVVSLAALLDFEEGKVSRARLAWGSVGPTVVCCDAAREALIGRALTLTSLREAAALAQKAVSPISDLRASAGYRRQVAGNLLLRLAMLPGA
jgi:xanthine dehydrogenase FAD-binding subunit